MSLIILSSVPEQTPEDFWSNLPALSWRSGSLTLGLAVFSIGIALLPAANDALQFDRSAAAAGELWRVFTGHFTHWGCEHLAWDLLVFVALGLICESADRRLFVAALVISSLLIPLGLWMLLPELHTYRGLSGLDTALFALLAVSALKRVYDEQRWIWFVPIAVMLICLVAKIAFEMLTHETLFVDTSSAGFQPVPLAHVLGAAVGIAMGCISPRGANK